MFFRLKAPQFSPTRCCACGSSACVDGFVDLLVEDASLGYDEKTAQPIDDPQVKIPTIGHLYLCGFCMKAGAHVYDYVSPEKHREILDRLEAAEAELVALREQLAAAEAQPTQVVALADVLALTKPKQKTAA